MWREPFVIILLVTVIVGLLILPFLSWLRERRRRNLLRALATRLGLRYCPTGRLVLERYPSLNVGPTGKRSSASNLLTGTFDEHPISVFDYYPGGRAVWGYDGDEYHPALTCLVLEHEGGFPKLGIYPGQAGAKLAQILGYDDMDFESIEFSDAFRVRATDRKFAYDVCHPRMMAYLLRHRDLSIEIEKDCIRLQVHTLAPRRLKVEEIPARLRQLVEIRNLLPEYLFRD